MPGQPPVKQSQCKGEGHTPVWVDEVVVIAPAPVHQHVLYSVTDGHVEVLPGHLVLQHGGQDGLGGGGGGDAPDVPQAVQVDGEVLLRVAQPLDGLQANPLHPLLEGPVLLPQLLLQGQRAGTNR